MALWLLCFLACQTPSTPEEAAPAPPAAAPAAPETPAAPTAPAAVVNPAAGSAWGAIFWREGKAWQRGGGSVGLGPKGAGALRPAPSGAPEGTCGALLTEAPERATLALPAGKTATPPDPAPANPAGLVERAAWRIDELLPPRDAFSPAVSAPDPALQRGMRVASVTKTRRQGAPPVVIASATRDCTAVIALMDREAARVMSWDRLDQTCEPLSILPAADYDGDGARELVAHGDHRVVLYRLDEKPGSILLERVGDWSCE